MRFTERFKELYRLNMSKQIMAYFVTYRNKDICKKEAPYALYGILKIRTMLERAFDFYDKGDNALSTNMRRKLDIAYHSCNKLIVDWYNTTDVSPKVMEYVENSIKSKVAPKEHKAVILDMPNDVLDIINIGNDLYTYTVGKGKKKKTRTYNRHHNIVTFVEPIIMMNVVNTILELAPQCYKTDSLFKKLFTLIYGAVEDYYKSYFETTFKVAVSDFFPKIWEKHFKGIEI